jgi:zinc transport system ATP-binding protein
MSVTRPFSLTAGTVRFGRSTVLSDVDFHVDEGDFTVILGSNGSGKTTLVKALLGLVPLEAGELILFGQPMKRFRSWSRIGYVPQRFAATAGVPATVEEVVLSGRVAQAPRFRPYRPIDIAAAHSALAEVNLTARLKDPVEQLSGGQQQRVLIARALAGEPDVLVLDEPISGVDHSHQEQFATTLAHVSKSGRTVVLVAHELGALQPLVTRAVVLDHGRVDYDGPPLDKHFHIEHIHHHPSIEADGGNR